MDIVVEYLNRQNKYSIVFDMHSFCYRREKVIPLYDDPNPEINIGTGELYDREFEILIRGFNKAVKKIVRSDFFR